MALTFLSFLDDVATMLKEVASVTKTAAAAASGAVQKDAAINAQKFANLKPGRHYPIIAELAKRSLYNKLIVVPAVLGISAIAPWAVTPLLLAGGSYLALEASQKLYGQIKPKTPKHPSMPQAATMADYLQDNPDAGPKDIIAQHKASINGAVRTDLILSMEIAIIALAAVATSPFLTQALVLTAVGLGTTAFVYSTVGAILAVDSLALRLAKVEGTSLPRKGARKAGDALLNTAPVVMKSLSIAGMAAMFMVSGTILSQTVPLVGAVLGGGAQAMAAVSPAFPATAYAVAKLSLAAAAGVAGGTVLYGGATVLEKTGFNDMLRQRIKPIFVRSRPGPGGKVRSSAPAPSTPAPSATAPSATAPSAPVPHISAPTATEKLGATRSTATPAQLSEIFANENTPRPHEGETAKNARPTVHQGKTPRP